MLVIRAQEHNYYGRRTVGEGGGGLRVVVYGREVDFNAEAGVLSSSLWSW
jgi:hypothetical protein